MLANPIAEERAALVVKILVPHDPHEAARIQRLEAEAELRGMRVRQLERETDPREVVDVAERVDVSRLEQALAAEDRDAPRDASLVL